jgi:hypothetical protein
MKIVIEKEEIVNLLKLYLKNKLGKDMVFDFSQCLLIMTGSDMTQFGLDYLDGIQLPIIAVEKEKITN